MKINLFAAGVQLVMRSVRSGAVRMTADEEGFEYPQIDPEKCVRCYKCMSVCPIKKRI